MKHIVCFHLFNDYSGSPKVLKMVLQGILDKGYRVDLITSKGGVLDELTGHANLKKVSYGYRFSANPVITMLRYSGVQVYTFLIAFRYLFQKQTVFYINTLLPVGPALAGCIMGKKVIYHYHENAFAKGLFYKVLAAVMQKLAHKIICVSQYQRSFLGRKSGVCVIPNALPNEFTSRLHPDAEAAFGRQTVLMLSSLKEYKGTREFIELANRLPEYRFCLVINDVQENIDSFFYKYNIFCSQNLIIYPRQNNVVSFYNEASIVINLTDKKLAVETFGLTALEAMSAGLPVIVPTEGGIAEMVTDGENGYKIDVQDLNKIVEYIHLLLSDQELYNKLSNNASAYSQNFDIDKMTESILSLFD
ncbi:glycosyltransferase family 4 protein [uncultured Coprobacter sp.]|uniref:glycosyltransferase family 4 protein n=1 Tax=uncultured Coprobacter sp. TaxID=1720550 RepID=UPI002607D072|nr:glycosyltransferase family 4 protein [uncultured Coprobacter sp.]